MTEVCVGQVVDKSKGGGRWLHWKVGFDIFRQNSIVPTSLCNKSPASRRLICNVANKWMTCLMLMTCYRHVAN